MKKDIPISDKDAEKRLDVFLTNCDVFQSNFVEKLSRNRIIAGIRSGTILLNNKPVKPNTKIHTNDIIFFDTDIENISNELVPNSTLTIPIISENGSFIVIDKPAGIQAHPSAAENTMTVANWIAYHYPALKGVGEDPLRPGIVHRLDKDTSGAMLVAKDRSTFEALKDLFKAREVQKKYQALVFGNLSEKEGIIDKPISRANNFRRQTIASERKYKGTPRDAVTHYKVINRYKDHDLVEAMPKTGRMHQIRLHLASLGHPVVGDKLYTNKTYQHLPDASRQLLHAHELAFELDGVAHKFTSELPKDFLDFLSEIDPA